jgi:hypothetical protein
MGGCGGLNDAKIVRSLLMFKMTPAGVSLGPVGGYRGQGAQLPFCSVAMELAETATNLLHQ